MLLMAAAAEWRVDQSTCRAENGRVRHESGKSLTFGRLAAKAAVMPVPKEVALKAPSEFTLIGKPMPRLDTPEKVTGRAIFGLDAHVSGMLTALVARPPVFGGKALNVDSEKARTVPGVQDVFTVPSGVAVVADQFWPAKKGRDLLAVTWAEGPGAKHSTPAMREAYRLLAQEPGAVARKDGDPQAVFLEASKKISVEYEVPYLAHAAMEPLNCVVDYREDRCDIWTGTQAPTSDRDAAAKILGLNPEQVHIHTTFLGGGFGRRGNTHADVVSEAAHVAKRVKKPVRVVWTREDDMKGGFYRPMFYDRLSGALDDAGNPIAWQHTIVGQSIIAGTPYGALFDNRIDESSVEGAADMPYSVPNIQVDLHTTAPVVPVLWWRSVGHSHTAFVVESFIDELALQAGRDPYEFRRQLLAGHPRHLGVLDLAAREGGWGAPLPAGRARGMAVHKSFGSFVAQVAEVSVDKKIRVHRVVCAVDCGPVVNPDTICAQMESGIVFGLTAALYGAITLKDGRVEQANFNTYPLLRMNEMPVVELHIVESRERQGGIGEPGVPPIAPAVANAVFAATGKRIRRLPFSASDGGI
jgi:isoquinoline 1-oxidoreductase beta subunit